jgi:hypothetical protein
MAFNASVPLERPVKESNDHPFSDELPPASDRSSAAASPSRLDDASIDTNCPRAASQVPVYEERPRGDICHHPSRFKAFHF